ncbi:N-acetylglucosamine-1-phosphodiester alpha-N-acetylglucosaminidase isoform X2 [Sceloporus undulatus]|uniref:N-acetylglucosamine-1-phosphodiester alpha-N-acetylglucosaminidase isoform X2 n=1 Tax=Sceloporus undulatus TaxID=8520 RepID=UPI001C4B12D1|nr:N-acetylglucosamine-1-phosphodiester alpha-N-acetylglucosaminidase isoform X2 [Sceloporus undulatus]
MAQNGSLGWRNSMNDDLCLPYPPPQHGPQRRLRYVRDCQTLLLGNATHELWPSDNSSVSPLVVTRGFVSYIPPEDRNGRPVYGHFTIVRDPLRTFSVLEPGGAGRCRSHSTATVEETARNSRCLVAQNGGYFNMDTGQCLGNIVSDGHLVQSSKGVQNAQFGIRKDGTLVFGYLSEEEVLAKENPFVQLVSGVVWLLRNGEVYVNQSRAVECDEIQTTGTFDKFINTVSARTAVGHDKQGQLVLVHVDGQTNTRGLNLWEMADFLKKQGVINAINLDGGGSATLVLNGTLASYPSDHCQFDAMWRCPRQISTVMCVHEPPCQPPDCSGHGHCSLGQCQCSGAFWRGSACNVLDCGPSNCSLHGMCTETGCLCDAGWEGTNCSEVCAKGSYGDGCLQKCLCLNGGQCDPIHGSCMCPDGYRGTLCEEVCPIGLYGPNCQHTCQCPNQCPCDQKTGSCNISSAMAGQCLLKDNQEDHLFTQKAWMGVTVSLLILLLVSCAVNMKLLFCRSTVRREHGKYTYHPLEEMNGETHSCPSTAWDKEDQVEEAWDPDHTERADSL